MVQQRVIQEAVTAILGAIGEDLDRPGLRDTPERVARMYQELFRGLDQEPTDVLATGFEEGHNEPVVLRQIPFFSVCEHHLLPFVGEAHLGYIPKGRVVGASKLVRALEVLARRPQLQERLTRQVADALYEGIQPEGVVVRLSAEHLCMTIRGVQKPGVRVLTVATRGSFQESATSRDQLMSLVSGELR